MLLAPHWIEAIDWGEVSVYFRLASVIISACCLLQFAMFLSHYFFRIIPLRHEVDSREVLDDSTKVLAPPVTWTFAYHLAVSSVVAYIGTGQVLALVYSLKVTFLTFCTPWVLIFMTLCLGQIVKFYTRTLREAAWKAAFDELQVRKDVRLEDDR